MGSHSSASSQYSNMDSKLFLVCLSGLCLSSYAAPFDPVATANSWVGSLSAQHVPVFAILQTPVVKPMSYIQPISVAAPVVKAATPMSSHFVVQTKPAVVAHPAVKSASVVTPVVKAATPMSSHFVVQTKPAVVAHPVVKSASVATPVVKAATPMSSHFVVQTKPVVVAHPVVKSASVAVASPVIVAAAPEPLDAPNPPMPSLNVPFVGGQFHAQDEMGQYAFGHHGGSSTRVETRDYLGRVTGSFSYVNPEGEVHVRKYAAASGIGFKVAGSDIPVDTPEVAAAKISHAEAIATAKAAFSS